MRNEKEMMKIFRVIQARFGAAQRWYEAGFEDQYVSIQKGTMYFSYTTGLRGEAADNHDMVDNIRRNNKEEVEKFLKSKGYDFVLESTSCGTLMLTMKG